MIAIFASPLLDTFLAVGPLALWDVFTDSRHLGLATLILVTALVIGVGVASKVPRDRGPNFFGTLAALAFVGLLAFFGVEAAGSALWIVLILAFVLGAFGLVA
jgi:hypothetical protein